ncbi:T9SS type A sorting domain-containing protein [Dyadobacter arcticus]|uniref:T9SS type A sorting domain-containing protein n=1 Tax=Dyadobacter arcticus TaxID=1078754 RepID=A0ABX0UJ39_9BACT|nr:T9SS type A sorting domain-containing protein [Dyadobacter arcticus]NIJ52946.1 hypothetical protein [Dyadobacter arcticus]
MTSMLYANAQSFSGGPPASKNKLPYFHKTYKSPTQLRAEEMVTRTRPGYYTDTYTLVNGNLVKSKSSALRTAATCENNYLCSSEALPATLISFKGTRLDATKVKLYWETSSETNNRGFDVERSETGTGDFAMVGTIDGSGDTYHTKKYEMTDLNNSPEMSYYRLKQVDYDGKFTYSRIIAIAGLKEELTVTAIPNPARISDMYLQIKGGKITEVELVVVDVKGVVVYRNEHVAPNAARQISLRQIPGLIAGLYHAKVISKEGTSTVAFVVTK